VDFTTHENYFLILTASLIIENRAVPLYFTMRNYPKTRGSYDHKRMEMAFLKGLRHILSKKYTYIIVADRGFSNERFMRLCDDNGFDFMIRTTPNLTVKHGQQKGIMEHICQHDGAYAVEIVSWKKSATLYKTSNNKGSWYLLSSLKEQDGADHSAAQELYENRFKIEKCFQDLKSSGFDIEKTKIRKYSNYKRLLAMVMVAHVLLVMLG
jgi:transposase